MHHLPVAGSFGPAVPSSLGGSTSPWPNCLAPTLPFGCQPGPRPCLWSRHHGGSPFGPTCWLDAPAKPVASAGSCMPDCWLPRCPEWHPAFVSHSWWIGAPCSPAPPLLVAHGQPLWTEQDFVKILLVLLVFGRNI